MQILPVSDRRLIASFLREDAALHIYSLGDLDDRFFPYTRWYGLFDKSELRAVLLLYSANDPPILLALAPPPMLDPLRYLLSAALPVLPDAVYCHIMPGMEEILQMRYHTTLFGDHEKYVLRDYGKLRGIDTSEVIRLLPEDRLEPQVFYDTHYPEHTFDARLLDIGQFFGIRKAGEIVCAAGIHVYSPANRVAALGNITTHSALRGQGLARKVTAHLCNSLITSVDLIGLNVKMDNQAAITLYRSLGFVPHARYSEILAERSPSIPGTDHSDQQTSPSSSL